MIERESAEPVIQYLRAVTYDGELSAGEVWELANWLNQQPPHIMANWPGQPLANALEAAFANKNLTETEMAELADTIVAIEQLWIETFPESALESAPPLPEAKSNPDVVDEGKPVVPSIPLEVEMPALGREATFTLNLQEQTCTCPEWIENRAAFPVGDYRRCCAHLAEAYRSIIKDQDGMRNDPMFAAFVAEHARRGRGAAVDVTWHIVNIRGQRVLYGASPASEWVTVFAPVDGAYKRFGYNRRRQRWSYGERPAGIAWQIASLFSPTQPQVASARAAATAPAR